MPNGIHTHVIHLSNFGGDFAEAYDLGMIEGAEFFSLCEDHAERMLTVTVDSTKSYNLHVSNVVITVECDFSADYDDEDDYDANSSSTFVPEDQELQPPF